MSIQFRQTEFVGVAAMISQCPGAGLPEIILSGRSNVGKSSLVNALADNRQLARTSNTPGKTRLIIYFLIDRRLLLVDLPGYGHAVASRRAKQAFSDLADQYLTAGRPIALVLLLLDIRHSPSAEDRQMIEWLEAGGLPYRIVLTKADKLSRTESLERRRAIAAELQLAEPDELLVFSAVTRQGVDDLRRLIAGC